MKKILVAILAAFLLISSAGCSEKTAQTDPHQHDHTHNQIQEETTSEQKSSSTTPATENYEDETTENVNPTTSSPNYDSTDVPVTLEKGTIDGNTYINKTLDLTFTKPSEWTFAEEDDLAYYSGIMSGGFGDFAATANENPAVYDMYATDKDGCTVSICYENLNITVGEPLTSDEYAEIIKTAISETPDSTLIEDGEITFGGHTYSKLVIRNVEDTSAIIRTYYLRAVGNQYMATIIATIPESAEISADNMFS